MPLSPAEIFQLSKRSLDLVEATAACTALTSEGGRKITREEARQLARLCAELALQITVDMLD